MDVAVTGRPGAGLSPDLIRNAPQALSEVPCSLSAAGRKAGGGHRPSRWDGPGRRPRRPCDADSAGMRPLTLSLCGRTIRCLTAPMGVSAPSKRGRRRHNASWSWSGNRFEPLQVGEWLWLSEDAPRPVRCRRTDRWRRRRGRTTRISRCPSAFGSWTDRMWGGPAGPSVTYATDTSVAATGSRSAASIVGKCR